MTNQFWRRLIELERRQLRAARVQTEISNRARAVQQAIQGNSSGLTATIYNAPSQIDTYAVVSSCQARLNQAVIWTQTSGTATAIWNSSYGSPAYFRTNSGVSYNVGGNTVKGFLFSLTSANYISTTTNSNGITTDLFRGTSLATYRQITEVQLLRWPANSYREIYVIKTIDDAISGGSYSFRLGAISWAFFGTETPLQSGTTGSFLADGNVTLAPPGFAPGTASAYWYDNYYINDTAYGYSPIMEVQW